MSEQEFYVHVPWGKIACISWGQSKYPPVLMVHGYMDSAATFIPLLKYLPKTYYYVGVDLPGHGKSSPFPVGPLVNHSCYVETVRKLIDHLKWDTFILLTHSIGFVTGNLYNNLHPFKISKMINLEPALPISVYSSSKNKPGAWFKFMYGIYYDNFSRWTSRKNKKYTYDQAITLVAKSRQLTKEQAAIVLSRVLEPAKDGLYRLTWEPCMKQSVGLPIPEEMFISIITTNSPPTLNIMTLKNKPINFYEANKNNLFTYFKEKLNYFLIYEVEGSHDVHITNPERFTDKIIDFLNIDFKNNIVSKI